jgi:hypothetical protein
MLCEYGISIPVVQKLIKLNYQLYDLTYEKLINVAGLGDEKIKQILNALDDINVNHKKNSVFELSNYGISYNYLFRLFKNNISLNRLLHYQSYHELSVDLGFKIIASQKLYRAISLYDKRYLKDNERYSELTLILSAIRFYKLNNFTKEQLSELLNKNMDTLNVENLSNLGKHLNDLVNDNYLEFNEGYYTIYKTSLEEEINRINDERKKDILIKRLNNYTLERIAQDYHITRERIRQIVSIFFRGIVDIKEDKYQEVFEKYNFTEELFVRLFKEDIKVYYYLHFKYQHGKKNMNSYKNEHDLDDEQKKIINDYLNVYQEGDDEVTINKLPIIIQILKESKIAINVADIIELYNNKIKQKELSQLSPLSKNALRGVDGILSRSRQTIASMNFKYRYYDLDNIVPLKKQVLINTILKHSGYFSTRYFMEKYPYIMNSYQLNDEYELHNLLKKIIDDSRITFLRMPHLMIDITDKNLFFKGLIEHHSPINLYVFMNMIHENTGYHQSSLLSYLQANFSKYIYNDIINSKNIMYHDDQRNILVEALKDDFYSIESFKDIVLKAFNEIDYEYFNVDNLNTLGYVYQKDYLYKNNYHSFEDCLKRNILKNEEYEVVSYNKTIDDKINDLIKKLTHNLDLVQISANKYLTSLGLIKMNISKHGLYVVIKDIVEDNKGCCFNSYQIINGTRNLFYLKEFRANDYFINTLLKSSKRLKWFVFEQYILYYDSNININAKLFINNLMHYYHTSNLNTIKNFLLEDYGMAIETNSIIKLME